METKDPTTSIVYLKRLYTIIVASILLFLIAQQYLLHLSISKSKAYSTQLNSAGRQRMFSQQIGKLSLLYAQAKNNGEQLKQTIDHWNSAYEDLLHGDNSRDIAPPVTDALYRELQTLDSFHTEITTQVDCLLKTSGEQQNDCLELVLTNTDQFMAEMERIVSIYEANGKQAIQGIMRVEYIMTIIAILIIFLEILFVFRPTRKIILQQENALRQKIKDLTDSINYAKKVQEAILPEQKKFTEYFPDSFVLYMPKDILAGDFYLIEQLKDTNSNDQTSPHSDILMFAVGDCTGHGVPGAMVSLICHNAMEKAVKELGLTNPATILDKVNELVQAAFSKNESGVSDGMDMSLCCLNRATRQLSWAGANIPLWIVRNTNGQAEVIELKPDKQPIGVFLTNKPFTCRTIELQKNDCIYLFSDGYSDQFGGELGKKFKSKQLQGLLLDHNTKSLVSTKRALHEALEKWKGELEQVDDITVIGVRF